MENFNGLNLSTASDVKIGTEDVQAIYLGNKLIWNREPDIPYFTIKAVENGMITIITGNHINFGYRFDEDITNIYNKKAPVNEIYYSINGGTWQEEKINFMNVSDGSALFNINVSANDLVRIKAVSLTLKFFPIQISANMKFEMSGNIMSLVYGDSCLELFYNEIDYPDYFRYLFAFTKCTSAENLIFPPNYSKNAVRCFADMFEGCIYLNKLPTFRITYVPLSAFTLMNLLTPATSIKLLIRDWAENPYDEEQVFYSQGNGHINSFLLQGNHSKIYTYDHNNNGYNDDNNEYYWSDDLNGDEWWENKELPASSFTIYVGKTKYKLDYLNPITYNNGISYNYMLESALRDLLVNHYLNVHDQNFEVVLLNEYA